MKIRSNPEESDKINPPINPMRNSKVNSNQGPKHFDFFNPINKWFSAFSVYTSILKSHYRMMARLQDHTP